MHKLNDHYSYWYTLHYYIYKPSQPHSKKECVQKRPRAKPKIIQKVRVLKHSCEHLQIKTSTWFYSLPHSEAKATFAKSWGSYRAVSSSQVPYNFHIIFFNVFLCRFQYEVHHKSHFPALPYVINADPKDKKCSTPWSGVKHAAGNHESQTWLRFQWAWIASINLLFGPHPLWFSLSFFILFCHFLLFLIANLLIIFIINN